MKYSDVHSLRVPDDWRSFVWYLAVDNIKRQYARTRLGPLWIVLTQFVTIFGIGLVFYSIFNKPLDQFLLFISASILAWNLISVSITTAPMTLVGQASLIQSFRLPYAIFPLQNLLNSLVVFLHGLAVHVLLLLLLGGSFRTLPLLIVSLLVVSAILYPTIAVLSILGSRFRDLAPLIGSLMYLVFLITPIIWDRPNLGGHLHWIVDFNPFYHMIEIIRRPMLGTLPPLDSVLVTLGMAIVAMTGGEWFYRRYARPIPFWV